MNEEEILTLFQRDAEAASEALVAQYRRLLWGICARRLNAPEDIDECVYAALAEFCLNWRQFDHSRGTLKSYLISIADKKALDLYRQNLRWQRMQKAAEHCAGQALRAPLEREWLFADMDGLGDREKWLLYLRYVSGYTYVEIARMLALPYEQVKKQGYRAYLKLKRAWDRN